MRPAGRSSPLPARSIRSSRARTTPPESDSAGQTLHGDHAYVFYQVPVNARKLPLVFWHGHGQSAKTWETTPDGREGFQNIFLRRRFPVYLIDQPRRGRAARSTQPVNTAGHARRAALVRHFPARRLAEFVPGRAVLTRPGGAQPVLPADGAEHRAFRYGSQFRRGFRALQPDRAGRSRHAFPKRRHWAGARPSRTGMSEPSFRMSRAATSFSQRAKSLSR